MKDRYFAAIICLVAGAFYFAAQAEFYPERICRERKKVSLDAGWRFLKTTPSGTASDSAYNDGAWERVNIPHSASYDEPTATGEAAGFYGVCWYRKTFTVPQAKHTGKIFIEFEGAMQVADVWLNGKQLGTHATSGYTGFSFDVTGKVSMTGQNVLAVRLDNRPSVDVPPGRASGANGPSDYYIYSGLYRDVWLVMTDQCFIPLYGQRITTPVATAASADVRIRTTVSTAAAGSVTVRYTMGDPSNNIVLTDSVTQVLGANQTYTFDKVSGPITSPLLWWPDSSKNTTSLYTLYTQVFRDGVLADDYADRFGVRALEWTPAGGFSINGRPTVLKGVSLHQSIGWVESALPRSRFRKEVSLVKEMGANLIRCAHFPRDPSFYNACDELGVLVMVEVPTWGTNATSYSDLYWNRLKGCVPEMVKVGYNHPSIIAWGIFNEPWAGYTTPYYLRELHDTAKKYDSTRWTYLADNVRSSPAIAQAADIEGLNYGELEGQCASLVTRVINSEYHEGWLYWCYRGAANDNESGTGYAMQRWNIWTGLFNATRVNKLAGATMWSFNDYWSAFIQYPMGVVDHYRIPKAVFYLFRKYWTGKASETPVLGLTPAKLQLNSDMDSLVCDSTDVAIVTASFRAADGRCVDTKSGPGDSIPVTFAVTGPANYFGPATVKAFAGKCAIIIKSKNTPGVISVSASAPGLTAQPALIQSVPADMSLLAIPGVAVMPYKSAGVFRNVVVRKTAKAVVVTFPSLMSMPRKISMMTAKGQIVSCPVSVTGAVAVLDTRGLASGCYGLVVGQRHSIVKKLVITN